MTNQRIGKNATRRSFWIPQELWDAARERARLEDRTVSSWLRQAITKALGPLKQ